MHTDFLNKCLKNFIFPIFVEIKLRFKIAGQDENARNTFLGHKRKPVENRPHIQM